MISRYPIDLILFAVVAAVQATGVYLLWTSDWARRSSRARAAILAGGGMSLVALLLAVSIRRTPLARILPDSAESWGRGAVLVWALTSAMLVVALVLTRLALRVQSHHSPARRAFLRTAQTALLAGPVIATSYGTFIERYDFRMREEDLPIPGLPEDLDGLRLVQLTDIHLSPFLSLKELDHVIGMANETDADVALVTGDLITAGGDPLDECLHRLTWVRSAAGTYGCLGNHEVYADAEAYAARRGEELGIRFLRHQAEALRFGAATLNLAGVDYQPVSRPYLRGVERLVDPDAFNILLSHNPDVFPTAAAKGFPLTISGHTHGGQINFEILRQNLSIARFLTPYVDGLYQEQGSTVWVSRGIGTIGIPARLGAPPEVALLRLCRS